MYYLVEIVVEQKDLHVIVQLKYEFEGQWVEDHVQRLARRKDDKKIHDETRWAQRGFARPVYIYMWIYVCVYVCVFV